MSYERRPEADVHVRWTVSLQKERSLGTGDNMVKTGRCYAKGNKPKTNTAHGVCVGIKNMSSM